MPAHEFKVDPLEELLNWFKQLLDPRSPQATFDNSRVFTTVPTTPGGPRIIVPSVNLPDPSKTPSSVPQPYQAESWGWVKDLYQSKTPSSVPQPYQAEPWGWIQDPYGGGALRQKPLIQVPPNTGFKLTLLFNLPVPAPLGAIMVQAFRNAGLRAEAPEIAGNEVRVAFTTGDVVRSSQDIANALSAVVKIMLLTSAAALIGLAIIGFILASGPSAFVKAGKGIAMAAEGASTAMQEIGRILNGNLFMNDSTNGDGNKTGRIPITLMILGGVALVLVLRR